MANAKVKRAPLTIAPSGGTKRGHGRHTRLGRRAPMRGAARRTRSSSATSISSTTVASPVCAESMHPTGDRFRHGSPLRTYDRFGDIAVVPIRLVAQRHARSDSSGCERGVPVRRVPTADDQQNSFRRGFAGPGRWRAVAGVCGVCRIARRRLTIRFVPDLIDNLRKQIQERLEQLLGEAEKLRRALAALDPRGGSTSPSPTTSPRPLPASIPRRRPRTRRPRGRTAPGATKARVLGALTDGNAMTAGEVASATGLPNATVSTTLSRLAKSGEVLKAERGYRLPT